MFKILNGYTGLFFKLCRIAKYCEWVAWSELWLGCLATSPQQLSRTTVIHLTGSLGDIRYISCYIRNCVHLTHWPAEGTQYNKCTGTCPAGDPPFQLFKAVHNVLFSGKILFCCLFFFVTRSLDHVDRYIAIAVTSAGFCLCGGVYAGTQYLTL